MILLKKLFDQKSLIRELFLILGELQFVAIYFWSEKIVNQRVQVLFRLYTLYDSNIMNYQKNGSFAILYDVIRFRRDA